jgi:hypothetical protein
MVGHPFTRVRNAATLIITTPEPTKIRVAVMSVLVTRGSERGFVELATALMITAAMPRSAKGRSDGKVASRPYWP